MTKIKISFVLLIIVFSFLIFLRIKNGQRKSILPVVAYQSSQTGKTTPKSFIRYNDLSQEDKEERVNILLLGLDGRAGDNRPRCDAIHMISFLKKENKIIITSVPRGTFISEGSDFEKTYISNICHIEGINQAVLEIEKIIGLKTDYVVKIGFSQAMGILRLFDLPAVSTLQFLRNRQISLGDFQRTHNQALFIKDMIITNFDRFAALPNSLKYLAFSLLDTDMSYQKADDLLLELQKSGLYKNPDNIILQMKPAVSLPLLDLHYNLTEKEAEINDPQYQAYQQEVQDLLIDTVEKAEFYYANNQKSEAFKMVETLFKQKFWEQLNDQDIRSQLYWELLKIFVLSSSQPQKERRLVENFIEEMKIYRNQEMREKGEELLEQLK